MEEFEARLAAAYQAWHASRGRTPEAFFALYDDDIELHSILEASLMDAMRGPFIGKDAALAYFTAIAEAWEMIAARSDGIRRVSVNPSQPARGENGCVRKVTMHCLLAAIEDVTTMT